jgi:hypothetical protein
MKLTLRKNRINRKDLAEENNSKNNIELDNYGVKLIKSIGIVGLIIGIVALALFYFWVFKKMF